MVVRARSGSDVGARSIAVLAAAVDAIDGELLDGLNAATLGEGLVALRRQIDRLEAAFCRRLRRFDGAQGAAAAGATSTVAWLRDSCRMSGGGAAARVEVARRLDAVPGAEGALRGGEIGIRHASVLARCVGEVGPVRAGLEGPALLAAAGRVDPDELRRMTQHLRHAVDPAGALADANAEHRRRWLRLSPLSDGALVIDGRLDAEGGATVRAALGAFGAPHAGDERSARERRADALVELSRRQLQGGGLAGGAGGRPHLLVTVPMATLRAEAGAPAAELGGARAPVTGETARRLACDAALSAVVVGEGGEPLNAGRTRRTVPPALRRALVVRDRHCRFPGCDRPPEWTDAHHLVHWVDWGKTRLPNLALLCRVHHRLVHEGGWQLEMKANGELRARAP